MYDDKKLPVVKFDGAIIAKFTTKAGKTGETIGQVVVEIESDNAFRDFADMHRFPAGTYVAVTIAARPDLSEGE